MALSPIRIFSEGIKNRLSEKKQAGAIAGLFAVREALWEKLLALQLLRCGTQAHRLDLAVLDQSHEGIGQDAAFFVHAV